MQALWQDLWYGLRMLRKSRALTGVAVLALALGMGANSAIFSLVDAVLLRPLPFQDFGRLMAVWESNLQLGLHKALTSAPTFLDFRNQNTVFEGMAAYQATSLTLTGKDEPERVPGLRVSRELFPVLGVRPAWGRDFTPAEMQAGGAGAVIVSHGFWKRRFGADAAMLGQPLTLDGKSFTVAGIMPPGFEFPDRNVELWAPLVFSADELAMRGYHSLSVIARLKPGVTSRNAYVELNGIATRLARQYPVTNRGWTVDLLPLREFQVRDIRSALLVLFGAVGFVLLIACASTANLLLARNAVRAREIAVRTALGAGRARLLRQLLTESLLLSVLSGGVGLALTPWFVRLLLWLSPPDLVLPEQVRVDPRVLGFTLAVSLLTGLVFGVIPALQGSRTELSEFLKEGSRSATGSVRRHRLRNILVVSEVAFALVLLVGAGLMLRSFQRLQAVDPGFRPDHLLTVQVSLPDSKYPQGWQRAAFYQALLERVSTLPGVRSAAATDCLPMVSDFGRQFSIEGRPAPAPGEAPTAHFRTVTPEYFRTMQIRLRQGRHFSEQDHAQAPGVAIVNEDLARRYWPNQDPLGQRISLGKQDSAPRRTIVGVVAGVRHHYLDAPVPAEMYVPYFQWPQASATLVVRTVSDPVRMAGAIRTQVRAVDKDQPLGAVRTMERVVSESVAPRRAVVVLLSAFSSLALILAGVGIYGVVSYSVAQRRHEIGIRLALGAQPREVLRLMLRQGLVLCLGGVALGALAALGLTRLLAGLLFGVSATDPWTFAAVTLFLIGVALLASYLPARAATRVDPIQTLRVG